METIEYTDVVDRSKWGEGPWDAESLDKMQWRDPISGLPVMIKRGPIGAWCGYVGIEDPDHPYFEKDYSNIDGDLQVHGGLTFASFCDEGEGDHGERICHIPGPGEPDRVWWLGFDTGHFMDQVPGFTGPLFQDLSEHGTYKTQEFVTSEVLNLARQVAEASQ